MVSLKSFQVLGPFSVATKITSPPGGGGQLKSDFAEEFSASS
jgi:hypothetical protein